MREAFFRATEAVRTSYWFIPSLMAAAAVALGAGVIWLDAGPGSDWLDGIGWYQTAKPDGAQEVLSTIAGSMITVAGVVFSITIVAIAFAANQYGPRILTNFMSDRGNQVTLGTFIATFLYCLMVLRTIRAGDEAFVPQLAVIVALLLSFCSIAVLIYFIHHVPQTIHINNLVARIGERLLEEIAERFPEGENGDREATEASARPGGEREEVTCRKHGYVQAIDEKRLLQVASERGLYIRILQRTGTFVYPGMRLAAVEGSSAGDPELAERVRHAFTTGNSRTPFRDAEFLVDELVEITARALSPGVNDPYTAMTCIDWLAAAAAAAVQRAKPPAELADQAGEPRLCRNGLDLGSLVERGFGSMRAYVGGDRIAAAHMMKALGGIVRLCRSPEAAELLLHEADELMRLAAELLPKKEFEALSALVGEVAEAASADRARRDRAETAEEAAE